MARVREFNEELALEKATELFWEKGYQQTSMRDLVKHTGVAHAGLYAAFGGKDKLFAQALKRYRSGIIEQNFGRLMSEDAGKEDLIGFFRFMQEAVQDSHFRHGCMVANTAAEMGESDHESAQDVVHETFAFEVSVFSHVLSNAVRKGELSEDFDVDGTAHFFAVNFYGLAVLVRANMPMTVLDKAITAMLNLLH